MDDLLTLSEWQLAHELPGAVVLVARELGKGDVIEGLKIIARDTSRWPGRVAAWLLADREELERLLGELDSGLRPRERFVDEVRKHASPA